MNKHLIYPRSGDPNTVYIKNVITRPEITAGDFSMYNDHAQDPRDFEKHNVFIPVPCQLRSADHRKILFHCLRCKIFIKQC